VVVPVVVPVGGVTTVTLAGAVTVRRRGIVLTTAGRLSGAVRQGRLAALGLTRALERAARRTGRGAQIPTAAIPTATASKASNAATESLSRT